MKLKTTVGILLISLLSGDGMAESRSDDLAKSAQRCWDAYQCTVLAAFFEKEELRKKFVEYGHSEGKRFINGVRNVEIYPNSFNKYVPKEVESALLGTNEDFILGVIWERASKDMFEKIKGDLNNPLPKSEQTKRAEELYPKIDSLLDEINNSANHALHSTGTSPAE